MADARQQVIPYILTNYIYNTNILNHNANGPTNNAYIFVPNNEHVAVMNGDNHDNRDICNQ